MKEIFSLCLRDFFTKKFLILTLAPFFGSLLIFIALLMFFAGDIASDLQVFALNLELSKNSQFIQSIFSSQIFSVIINILVYGFGFFLSLVSGMLSALLISSFFTPIITKFIGNKYYSYTKNEELSNSKIFSIYIKIFFRFFGIFLLALICLMIPLINLIALNLAFFYLYYKFMLVDISSSSLNKNEALYFIENGVSLKFTFWTFLFYLACLLPLVGLFFQIFFIMCLTHIIYRTKNYE